MEETNYYISKNDMMFFQDEILTDIKNIKSFINTKLTKLDEETRKKINENTIKINDFSNKMKELLELVTSTRIDHQKVEELYKNKDNLKAKVEENRLKILDNRTLIDSALYKYDKAIIDNLEVPGLIGFNCKFSNIKKFLSYTNEELENHKDVKKKQITEINSLKEKIDTFNKKINVLNTNLIDNCDKIYNNKFSSFKNDIDNKFENINSKINKNIEDKINELLQLNEEIKKKIKEDIHKEIDIINNEIKKNKEIIDSNCIIVNKQKEDFNLIKKQINQINEDLKKLKTQNNLEKQNYPINSRKLYFNKIPNIIDKNNSKVNYINKNIQKISLSSDLINENRNIINNNIINKNENRNNYLNEDYEYISPNKQQEQNLRLINKNDYNIEGQIPISKIIKSQSSFFNQKNDKNIDIYNNDFKEDEKLIFKRKINKKLTYNYSNYLTNNVSKNLLELYKNSFSISNDIENKQIKKIKLKNEDNKQEKLNIKVINEQVNSNLKKENNIKIEDENDSNVLIKIKPIKNEIKYNLKTYNQNINSKNKEKSNLNKTNSKDNYLPKYIEKGVNASMNTFKKKNIFSKMNFFNNNRINGNDTNDGIKGVKNKNRSLYLTDKEILENLYDKYENKDKNESITKAISIQNYKNLFNTPIKDKKNIKYKIIYPLNDCGLELNNNNYQKNNIDKFYVFNDNENKFYISPLIRNKSLLNQTDINIYNKNDKKNEYNLRFSDENLFYDYLNNETNRSLNDNAQDIDNIGISKKLKKIDKKLYKISYDTKNMFDRLNIIEENFKPLNLQINDILSIIYLIYIYIKKRNIENIKLNKEQNQFFPTKNNLYCKKDTNLEEGGFYSSKQKKEELDIIKKTENFLIKQFKDII